MQALLFMLLYYGVSCGAKTGLMCEEVGECEPQNIVLRRENGRRLRETIFPRDGLKLLNIATQSVSAFGASHSVFP